MKLVLFSGGDEQDNDKINKRMITLASHSNRKKIKDLQIAYIPADSYFSPLTFQYFSQYWQEQGLKKILFFPLMDKKSERLTREVFNSDIIFLSGGNTFELLNSLRRSKLFPWVRSFAHGGGVLAGLSAGGIMMTPTITTASFPEFDCDENHCHLKNFRSLNLVNFEFFPHYKNSDRYNRELAQYSKKISYPLLAMGDGDGIVIDGHVMEVWGRARVFVDGKTSWIND